MKIDPNPKKTPEEKNKMKTVLKLKISFKSTHNHRYLGEFIKKIISLITYKTILKLMQLQIHWLLTYFWRKNNFFVAISNKIFY